MIAKRTTMMKQPGLGLNLSTKLTRKREFLDEMKRVVPWAALVAVIGKKRCRTSRCTASSQVWATARCACPDESTILRFRHLLEAHDLAPDMLRVVNGILQAKGLLLRAGTAVDATLIAAPSSTKNASGERDPEMKQTKKGNNWYFGMKAHIGVDADSGLVHTVAGTAADMSDLNMAGALLHGQELDAFADAGYQGVHKREEAAGPTWRVAMRRGLRKKLNPFLGHDHVREQIEQIKASVRHKVEHPFRVIKRQFGFAKVRYRGLEKNTAQLVTRFALSNLWMARRKLMATQG